MTEPRRVEFFDVTDREGNRYLVYLCHTCRRYHTVQNSGRLKVPTTTLRKLLRESDELIIHCGRGKAPAPRRDSEDSMIVSLSMQKKPTSKVSKKISRRLYEIKYQSAGITRHRMRPPIRSIAELVDQEKEKVQDIIEGLQRDQKQLDRWRKELEQMDKGKG